MDGRGHWMDNVFIERVWRSLKYEDIYLKGYADGREAKPKYFAFYNERRLHQALSYRAPMCRRARRRSPNLWTCGQRKRIDNMFTPRETEPDSAFGGMIERTTSRRASNFSRAKYGPASRVHYTSRHSYYNVDASKNLANSPPF